MDARAAWGSGLATPALEENESTRYRYLDGLRGWAALAVVIFHSSWELFGRVIPQLASIRLLLNDGSLAVFVFFVLTGFVFSRPHLTTTRLERIARSSMARYVRLTIPILAASLLGFVLLECGAMYNSAASAIVGSGWLDTFFPFDPSLWTCLKFSFYDVYLHYRPATSYNVFLWPMQLELLGSFLILAMVALFDGGVGVRALSCVSAILVFLHAEAMYLPFVYGYVLANLHVAMRDRAVTRGVAGDIAGLLLVIFVAIHRMNHDGFRTAAALGACLVLATLLSPLLQRLLSSSLSQWLGRISFPLYLLHSLVICTFSSFLIVRLHDLSWSPAAIATLVIPATILVSLGAAHIFTPVERLATRTSHRFAAYMVKRDAMAH
jgi:peptidoglycan/LPS O-acetylase OafA/YrhL